MLKIIINNDILWKKIAQDFLTQILIGNNAVFTGWQELKIL